MIRPSFLRTSLVAELLRDRTSSALIASAGFLHLAFSATPVGGLSCPLLRLTGVPCAGCGLTRSIQQILAGHFRNGAQMHLFGPLALFLLLLFAAAALLSANARMRLAEFIEQFEHRTAITPLLLLALFVYWFLRLGLLRGDYLRLMR